MKGKLSLLVTTVFFIFLGAVCSWAIPWKNQEFYYFAQDEELQDLIRNFCLSQGVNVVIDPMVEGQVSGLFEDIAPDDFLNQLSKAYGLIWFYDGNVLYVEPFNRIISHIVQVEYYDASHLRQMLSALGIEGSNFALRSLDKQGLMLISGSPRFVATVVEILGKLESNEKARQDQLDVAIFYLNHSWAYDLKFKIADTQMKVPGLATVLASLMSGNKTPEVETSEVPAAEQTAGSMPSISSIGAQDAAASRASLSDEGEDFESGQTVQPQKKQDERSTRKQDKVAVIRPDIRLNAVIVRDVKKKLPIYESLIEMLDVPLDVIQIEAAIVDLSTDFILEHGNNFLSGARGAYKFNISTGGTVTPTLPAIGDPDGAPTGGIDGASAQVRFPFPRGVHSIDFLSQIKLLETKGDAKVLSRPIVITLDNVEAAIQQSTKRFIPVAGERDAKLFDVNTETLLRVTPHIIDDKTGLRKIKLLISINNGTDNSAQNTVAGTSALTSNTSISTQSIIYEGESLLIGGFFSETKNDSYSGIPFVSRIPFMGNLFKIRSKKDNISQRLFLITPKIVTISYGDPDGYAQYFEGGLHGKTQYDKDHIEQKNANQEINKITMEATESERDYMN